MNKGYGQADPALEAYVAELFQIRDPLLSELQARADEAGLPDIQVNRFDGRLLEVLTLLAGARTAVEIGTLAGFSAVQIARGLGPEGRLDTFEFEPKHAEVARANLARAGLSDRVHVHVGKALEQLPKIEERGPFDLVFIDADKESYPAYLAWAEEHLRVGGWVALDNAFAWGRVLDPSRTPEGGAIHAANTRLATGGRFRATMVPTAEGLALGVKIR